MRRQAPGIRHREALGIRFQIPWRFAQVGKVPNPLHQRGGAQPISMFEEGLPRASHCHSSIGPGGSARYRFLTPGQDVLVVEGAGLPAAGVRGVKAPRLPDRVELPVVESENDGPAEAGVVELRFGASVAADVVTPIAMIRRHLARGHVHHGPHALACFSNGHFLLVEAVGEIQRFLQFVGPRRDLPRHREETRNLRIKAPLAIRLSDAIFIAGESDTLALVPDGVGNPFPFSLDGLVDLVPQVCRPIR